MTSIETTDAAEDRVTTRQKAAEAREYLANRRLEGEELAAAETHSEHSATYLPAVFSSSVALTRLDLSSLSVTDLDTVALSDGIATNVTLETLVLSNNFWITDQGMSLLAGSLFSNRTLTHIEALGCARLTEASYCLFLDPLVECNWALTTLQLSSSLASPFSDAHVDRWLRINQLGKTFSNTMRGQGDEGEVPVSVNLSSRVTTQPMTAWSVALLLDNLPKTVRYLSLAGQPLDFNCAGIISRFLQTNRSVESLDLRQCGLIDSATSKIALALDINSTLTSLTFGTKGNDVDPDVEKYVELMLYLNSQPCNFKPLALRMMEKDDSLTFVQLDATGTGKVFDERMTEIVSTAVSSAPFVRSVATTNCGLSGASALLWAKVLRTNSTLQLLDLSGNEIGEAASALAQVLKSNDSLFTLKLASCSVPQSSAMEIAEALRRNRSLTELDLSDNPLITGAAAASLSGALAVNSCMKVIRLQGTSVPAELLQDVDEKLRTSSEPPSVRAALPQLRANVPSFTKLDASGKSGSWWLRDSSARLLAQALGANKFVTSVDVSANQIQAEGMATLCRALLSSGAPIEALNCSQNPLGNGIEDFEEVLLELVRTSRTLRQLDVSATGFTLPGAQRFIDLFQHQRCALRSMDTSRNILIDANTTSELQFYVNLNVCSDPLRDTAHRLLLSGQPPAIRTLDVSNVACGLPDRDVTASVRAMLFIAARCPTLSTIILHGNSIGLGQVEVIASAIESGRVNISKWDLSGNELDDKCIDRLVQTASRCYDVKSIDVSSSRVACSPFVVKTLQARLEFNSQPLAVKEALLMSAERGEPTLDFSTRLIHHLTDHQLQLLCSSLTKQQFFTSIDVSNNHVGNEGFRCLVELALGMPSLITLKLKNTLVREPGVSALAERLLTGGASSITHLDLSCNDLGPRVGAAVLSGLRSNLKVTKIELEQSGQLDDTIEEICRITEANALQVRRYVLRMEAGDPTYVAFTKHPHQMSERVLRYLAQALRGNKHVTHLDLSGHAISDIFGSWLIGELAAVKTLRKVNLSDNNIGDVALDRLLDVLRNSAWPVTSINLLRVAISDEKLQWLASTKPVLDTNTTLTELLLEDRGIEGLRHYASSFSLNEQLTLKRAIKQVEADDPALTRLDLGSEEHAKNNVSCYELLHPLSWNTHLAFLSLAHGEIDDTGAAYLCQALFVNRSVTYLDLSHNLISDDGAIQIADVLKVNGALRTLLLEGNEGITSRGAASIETVLRGVNDAISAITIDRQHLPQAVAEDVDFSLLLNNSHPSLKKLYGATDEVFTTIDCHNPGALGKTFDDTACKLLCELLAHNTTVTHVDLSNTQITIESCFSIENMLKANTSITSLDISGNVMGEGLKFVVRSLCVNKTLRKLAIEGIPAEPDLRLKLGILLRSNREPPRFKEETLLLVGDDTVPATFVVNSQSYWASSLAADGGNITLIPSSPPSEGDPPSEEDPFLCGTKLCLDDESMSLASTIILRGTSLRTVDFGFNAIRDQGFASLLGALTTMRFIREILLSHNFLTDESVTRLCDALPDLPMLRHVDLSHNRLSENSVVRAQDTARQFPQLHTFALNDQAEAIAAEAYAPLSFYLTVNSHATDEARDQLIRAVTNDSTLTSIVFTGYRADAPWRLDGTYMSLLAFAIEHNTSVEKLAITDSYCSDELLDALLGSLRSNASIVSIDLSQNGLEDVTKLCDVLLQRQIGLRELVLSHNRLAVVSARALAGLLRTTEDLEVLDVRDNAWARVGATIVQSSLQSNRGLRHVELEGKNVPASVVTAAKYAVEGLGKGPAKKAH